MEGNAGGRQLVRTVGLLLLYSAVLSICATLIFRSIVFPPPSSAFELLEESRGTALVLMVGGLIAAGVTTAAWSQLRRVPSSNRSGKSRYVAVAAAGPLTATVPGVFLFLFTMGWYGLALVVALTLAATGGYWLILRLAVRSENAFEAGHT